MRTCHYCGPTDAELRPYGPGGSTVCGPCVKATPERAAAAREVYLALFDAAYKEGGGVVTIGHEDGPRPGVQP